MSGFIPGYAAPDIPLYEADTEIITVIPTSSSLSFPDPIPNFPSNISYPVTSSANPVNSGGSYLISAMVGISISNVGNGFADLYFRLGGATNSQQDYIYIVPMLTYIQSNIGTAIISFTGLVRVLSGQFPRLYVYNQPSTDTTNYDITQVIINYKTL